MGRRIFAGYAAMLVLGRVFFNNHSSIPTIHSCNHNQMDDLLKQPFPKQRFGNIQFKLPIKIGCLRFHLQCLLIGVGSQTLRGRNPTPLQTKHCNFRRKFNPYWLYELLTVEKNCPPTKYDYVHFHGQFLARWQFISSSNWDWNPIFCTFQDIPGGAKFVHLLYHNQIKISPNVIWRIPAGDKRKGSRRKGKHLRSYAVKTNMHTQNYDSWKTSSSKHFATSMFRVHVSLLECTRIVPNKIMMGKLINWYPKWWVFW